MVCRTKIKLDPFECSKFESEIKSMHSSAPTNSFVEQNKNRTVLQELALEAEGYLFFFSIPPLLSQINENYI